MKTRCGLAAAAVLAALAIVTGVFSHDRDRPEPERSGGATNANLLEMRASLLDVWHRWTDIPGDGSGLQGVSQPLLFREDDAYPDLQVIPTETPTPEPTSTPTATATRPAPLPTVVATIPAIQEQKSEPAPASDVEARFVQGWIAGGGDPVTVRLVLCIMGKESGGNPSAYNAAGPFYGLMQFLGSTWAAMGGGDWRDPYTQGINTARLWHRAAPSTQWPVAYSLCAG